MRYPISSLILTIFHINRRFTMELANRIRQFPKELQDLIGEFNVNHRIQMRNILNQRTFQTGT